MPPALNYGVATSADVAGMTGRQMLEAMIAGRIPAPPIAQTLSFWLAEVGDGTCVFEGDTGAHLLNPLGGVHGGWALTLIDSATGCAAHTLLPAGIGYATVETKANLTRPIRHDTGRVRAEGRRDQPRPPDHDCGSEHSRYERPHPRPRHLDVDDIR